MGGGVEELLLGGVVSVGGEEGGKESGRVNIVQILCIHVCEQKINTFQELGEGG
jgi:hypothetical protein